jgi:hypothetical protein
MGRVAIRVAIAEQMEALGVPYLGTVFPARPVIIQEEDYVETMNGMAVATSDSGSCCVLVVNMPDDDRMRRTDTGRGHVDDTNIHQIVLELFFASTGGDAIAAQLDYDGIVDALIVAIRNNPTPGGASVVWSAAEYKTGVKHRQATPYSPDQGLTILINGTIRYDAWEWIAGTDV